MEETLKPDNQIIELLGRHRLSDELLQAGLEVALPLRDRGIDLIAYADVDSRIESFVARPIQMKAASRSSFGLNQKYGRLPDLIIAFVWFLNDHTKSETYALTYQEAFKVAEAMDYTKIPSWETGSYSTSNPSRKLRGLLEQYKMTPEKWWHKITGKYS